ncbi:MAG: M1 family aminopeptidase [Marinifilaceae bacterium]
MFKEILLFELRRAFRSPSLYIYWGILFLIAFLLMNLAGGAFESLTMSIAGDNLKVNSPGLLNIIFGIFSYIGIFIVASVTSTIVIKDFRYDTLSLVFTTRIKKSQYILGRFTAAFILNLIVFTAVGFGTYIGTIMPYLRSEYFGEFMWAAYLNPYAARIIPNIFFITAIFFSLSLLLRNVIVNWLSILAFYILYAIGSSLLKDLDSRNIAALLDPFGMIASLVVTTGTTASEMNKETVSVEGIYLMNRILWISIGVLSLFLAYMKFEFSFALKAVKLIIRKKRLAPVAKEETKKEHFNLPQTHRNNSIGSLLKILKHQISFELKYLSKNVYFIIISLIAIIFMFVSSKAIGKMFDTQTYPVTYQVIDILKGSLSIFLYIIIILFSGELLSRDKAYKIDEIVNTQTVKRWILLVSKMISLAIAVAGLLLLMILCGILFQANADYYNFEISQYFISIFGLEYIKYILLIGMAFFVHSLINNKYIGYVILIVFMIWQNIFAGSILQHNLLIFGSSPEWFYSDMNGYGFSIFPYWAFKTYWLLFTVILVIISNLFLVVQSKNNLKARLLLVKTRLNKGVRISLISVTVLFIICGTYIFVNTNITNTFKTAYSQEEQMVSYEKLYKKYQNITQPKITDVKLNADIYPKTGKLHIEGTYWLKNKSSKKIECIHVNQNKYIKHLSIERNNKLISADKYNDYYIYSLNEALQSGDSIKLKFTLISDAKGFTNSGKNNIAHKNGTFFNNRYFPSIGYNSDNELMGKKVRAKHNLIPKAVNLAIDDKNGISRNFITSDSDFINFEATVSTSSDQIALTPGRLVNKWEKDGRNYFHYRMQTKMINFYAILSAKYDVYKEKHKIPGGKEIEISIYHHPMHKYNLKTMARGVKQSLDYYSKTYSDFQYDQLRIVEFPRFSSFAQSFPNMIPFSEGIGFIADLRELNKKDVPFDELKIDYPFYVTAHEMAHQWWAHQTIAANVEGAQMLMESVTQYSAFKVMEKYYGKQNMKKFLRSETFRYLNSRKNESYEEKPLSKVASNQGYIYYQKGGQALYAIDDYIGGDKLSNALKELNKKYAFKGAPYPTTNDFLDILEPKVPDSLKYFVNDIMNKITLYDNDVRSAHYTRNEDFEYLTEIEIEGEKYYADGKGEETKANMNDLVEIGIYNVKGKQVMLKKVRLLSGLHKYKFKLNRKPSEIIIDPYYKIIDKDYSRTGFKVTKQK